MSLINFKYRICIQIPNRGAIVQPNCDLLFLLIENEKYPSPSTIPVITQGLREVCIVRILSKLKFTYHYAFKKNIKNLKFYYKKLLKLYNIICFLEYI
jgi:hypothetical protein